MKMLRLTFISVLSLLIGIRASAADIAEMRAFTGSIYDKLWKKAGSDVHWNDDWTYKALKDRLAPWEYNFLIAAMFNGLTEGDSFMDAMSNFFDHPDKDDIVTPKELVAAYLDIGSRNMACAIEAAVAALKQTKLRKFDEASGPDYELIDSAISKAYTKYKEEDLEIQFFKYIQEKTKVEPAGAVQPATKPAVKPTAKDQPSPPTSKDGPQ
ncbi:MAG: hypothetical protein NTW21_38815 [Verrucomicrobia bacterium]|nr:hypothetical protein [Verrucomicrobiota bacterium]